MQKEEGKDVRDTFARELEAGKAALHFHRHDVTARLALQAQADGARGEGRGRDDDSRQADEAGNVGCLRAGQGVTENVRTRLEGKGWRQTDPEFTELHQAAAASQLELDLGHGLLPLSAFPFRCRGREEKIPCHIAEGDLEL